MTSSVSTYVGSDVGDFVGRSGCGVGCFDGFLWMESVEEGMAGGLVSCCKQYPSTCELKNFTQHSSSDENVDALDWIGNELTQMPDSKLSRWHIGYHKSVSSSTPDVRGV